MLGSDDVHVEHIIPQKIKTKRSKDEFGDWVSYLGDKADLLYPKAVSKIGNLTLFSGALNIGASNNPFANKKKAYQQSAILMTNELTELPSFKFKQVDSRSKQLADLAVPVVRSSKGSGLPGPFCVLGACPLMLADHVAIAILAEMGKPMSHGTKENARGRFFPEKAGSRLSDRPALRTGQGPCE